MSNRRRRWQPRRRCFNEKNCTFTLVLQNAVSTAVHLASEPHFPGETDEEYRSNQEILVSCLEKLSPRVYFVLHSGRNSQPRRNPSSRSRKFIVLPLLSVLQSTWQIRGGS